MIIERVPIKIPVHYVKKAITIFTLSGAFSTPQNFDEVLGGHISQLPLCLSVYILFFSGMPNNLWKKLDENFRTSCVLTETKGRETTSK